MPSHKGITMDKKLKAKWVKALRSGDYEQTNYALHDSGGYCCLGVLCSVAGADDNELIDASMPMDTKRFKRIVPTEVANALASFNDDDGMPFDLIAGFVQET